MPTEELVLSVCVVIRKESRRMAEAAFAYAADRDMDVTAVSKKRISIGPPIRAFLDAATRCIR